MTRATFEMDNSMPDLTDDFDFGAFLNLPPDDDDQGVEDGPTAWTFDESGHTFDFMPELCDERRLDVPWHSHKPTHLDPSKNAEARQSTNFQSQTNNTSPRFGYGASDLYGDEIAASGCVRPAFATVSKPTESGVSTMGYCGEVCTIPSEQESPPSLASEPASPEAPENHCTCITCIKIFPYGEQTRNSSGKLMCHFPNCLTSATSRSGLWSHQTSHYGRPGGYKCLEQDCQIVTINFYELRRHYKKHCTSPNKEQFPCPVSWCQYSGNNGFARKDKLKSHYRNIHEGKPGPLKAGRVIKPATLKPRVSSIGNGASKRKE